MATRVRRVQLDASSSSDDEKPVAPRQLGDARERLSASSSSASSLSHSRAAAPAPVSSQPAASRQQPRVASASTTSSTALSTSTSRAPTPQKQSRAADSAAAPTTTTAATARAVALAPPSPASSLAETGDKPLPLPARKSSALLSSSAAASASHPLPAGVKTSATIDSSPSSSLSSTTSDITPALATAPPSQSAPRRPSAPVLRRVPSPDGSTGTDNATNTAAPLEPTSQRRAEAPSAASGFNFGFRKPEDAARPLAESKHTAPVPPPSFGPSGANTRAPLATAVATTEAPPMPPSAAAALGSRAATTAVSTTPVRERRAESVRRGLSSLFSDETPTPKAERLPPPPPSRSEAPGLSRLFDIKARADVGASAAAPPLETALDAEAHARIAVRRLRSGTPSSSSSSSTSASPRVRPQVTKQATSSAHFEDESSSEGDDDDEADVRSGPAARNAEQKWHVGAGGVNRHAERAQLSAPVDASPPPQPPLAAATTTPTSASLAPTQFNRVFVAPRGGGGTSEGSSGWGRIGVPMARPRHPPHTHKANRTDAEEDEGRSASGRRASAPKVASATDGALFTSEGGRVTLDDTRLTRKRTSMTTRLASIEPARPDPLQGSAAAVAAALSLPTNSSASPSVRGTEQMTSVDGLEDGGRSGSSTPPPPPSLASPMDQEESATARAARLAAVKTTAMKVRRLLEPRLTIVGDADAANTQPQPLNLYSHVQTKNATTALSDWLLNHPLSATNTIIRTGNSSTKLWAPQTGAVKGGVDGSDVWFRHTPLGYAACSTSQAQSEARVRRAIQRRCGATAPKPSHAARPTLTPAGEDTANAGAPPPRACAKEAIPWTSTWRDAVLTAQLGAPARISAPIGHHDPAASTPTTRVTVRRHHRKPREASALLFGNEVGETEQASPSQRAHFSSRRDDGVAGRTLESDVAYNMSSAAPNTGTASALDGKGRQSSLFRAPPTWRTRGTSVTRAGPGGEASAWLSSSWAAAPPPPPPATAVASQSSRSPSGVDTPPRPARPAATMVRRDPGHGAEDAAAPQRTNGIPKSKGAA